MGQFKVYNLFALKDKFFIVSQYQFYKCCIPHKELQMIQQMSPTTILEN